MSSAKPENDSVLWSATIVRRNTVYFGHDEHVELGRARVREWHNYCPSWLYRLPPDGNRRSAWAAGAARPRLSAEPALQRKVSLTSQDPSSLVKPPVPKGDFTTFQKPFHATVFIVITKSKM